MVERLETSRLMLRELTVADSEEAYVNWTSSAAVAKYLTWAPHTSVDITREWLSFQEKSASLDWGIILKETNQLIGNISVIEDKPKIKTKTLGYVLGEGFWNQGYMSEALEKVIEFLFMTTDVNRIEAEHDTNNPGSGRVMEKSGMHFEGVLR